MNASLTKGQKIKQGFVALRTLTGRHLKMFFRNKLAFFFSLMVPTIIIIIYAIFLRNIELAAVDDVLATYFTNGIDGGITSRAHALVDAWMLSGIIGVSCISVSFNTCYIIVADRESGANRDFASAPIPRATIITSYFLFNFIVTFIICFVILLFCLIYLGAMGAFYISFANVMGIIGTMIISILSACLLTIFIASFITSSQVFNSMIAIISAAIGFLIGAYLPNSMLPEGAQYVTMFFSGTYSTGMFRNLFLEGQFNNLFDYLNVSGYQSEAQALLTDLESSFSMNLNFFDHEVNIYFMCLALVLFTLIYLLLNFLFANKQLERTLLGKFRKRKNKDVKLKEEKEEEEENKSVQE